MKRQRSHTPSLDYPRFMRQWVVGALAVWLVAPAFYVVMMIASMFLLGFINHFMQLPDDLMGGITVIALIIGSGVVTGWTIGYVQQDVVRRMLYWDLEEWRRTSLLGGFIASIITATAIFFFLVDIDAIAYTMMPIFVTVLALWQWRVLRRSVNFAWLWVLGNFVGALSFNHFVVTPIVTPPNENVYFTVLVAFVGVVLQGFITGHVMIHLVENHGYSPFRAHSASFRKESSSIWDEAV